ncbi:MAG: hypothetical protein HQL63_06150 [Magnetococcales bacterium]|nr:hypothetical protein [Magnetococcales bacterium]MBF0321341.1 hypothetical protein [Magnetococcales bacterium]
MMERRPQPQAYRSVGLAGHRSFRSDSGSSAGPAGLSTPPFLLTPQRNIQLYAFVLSALASASIGSWAFLNNKPLSTEENLVGLSIIVISLYYSFKWYISRKKFLPFVEIYSLVVGVYYGLPMIFGTNDAFVSTFVTQENRVKTGLVVLLSLIITSMFYRLTEKPTRRDTYRTIKVIPHRTAVGIFQTFLALSTIYNLLFVLGVVQPLIGNFLATMNILSTNVLGTISSYILFRLIGEGKLSKNQVYGTIILIFFSTIVISSGLMLINIILWILPPILGYTLGHGRIPLKVIVLLVGMIAVLSIGKGTARSIYWGTPITSVVDIFQRFTDWTNISFVAFQAESTTSTSMLTDRLNFSGVLGMVIQRTPEEVPFIGGTTYAMLISMIVPRFIWPEKPDGHAATIFLGIHYGIHTLNEVIATSIGIGLLGESYANFGMFGIVVFSIFIGWVLGYAHRVDITAPPLSMRSFVLIGLLNSVTKIEFALVEIIIPLIQIGVLLLLIYGWLFRHQKSNR